MTFTQHTHKPYGEGKHIPDSTSEPADAMARHATQQKEEKSRAAGPRTARSYGAKTGLRGNTPVWQSGEAEGPKVITVLGLNNRTNDDH